MKAITSAGGPYIIIDQSCEPLWGGIERHSFSQTILPFANDYEAACDPTVGVPHHCNIAKLIGAHAQALFISVPFELAIVDVTPSSAYLAQVQYADPDWSFSQVSLADFEEAQFNEKIAFGSAGAAYEVFDSSYPSDKVGQDCLKFSLIKGDYILSSAMYQPDEHTGLFLYKITEVK